MKIWVTKYAVTSGIEEYDLPNSYGGDDGYFSHTEHEPVWRDHFYTPKEWYKTREEAVANANNRVSMKIASVRKQLSKLEGMKFT